MDWVWDPLFSWEIGIINNTAAVFFGIKGNGLDWVWDPWFLLEIGLVNNTAAVFFGKQACADRDRDARSATDC